jgi:hypothetical protein
MTDQVDSPLNPFDCASPPAESTRIWLRTRVRALESIPDNDQDFWKNFISLLFQDSGPLFAVLSELYLIALNQRR